MNFVRALATSAALIALVVGPASRFVSADELTGSIVGSVLDEQTKKPIPNAAVTAMSQSGVYRATSDSKGQFAIAGVAIDTYTISVEAAGFASFAVAGATVSADSIYRVSALLGPRQIANVTARARSITSPFNVNPTDKYSYNAASIDQLLGKSYETSGATLLSRLPSVTVDANGTPLIRGGRSFETAFEVEGIDYEEPNASLTNRFENIGNADLLNGVGSLEIIPGSGDATHGNSGTGLIVLTEKRGTLRPFSSADYEVGVQGDDRQAGFEDGRTLFSGHLQNYMSFISTTLNYQYGEYGSDPRSLSASATTPDPNIGANVNVLSNAPFTSAFFNTGNQDTRDFIENMFVRFGHENSQSLQFFFQHQDLHQNLNYGGTNGLTYPFVGNVQFSNPAAGLAPLDLQQYAYEALHEFAQFPGGSPGAPLTGPDQIYSPFTAFKFEYRDNIGANTSAALRYYRTFSDQQEFEPSQGLYAAQNGGIRTGVSSDVTRIAGSKNVIQFGAKYEFAQPFGEVKDYVDYLPAYGYAYGVPGFTGNTSGVSVLPDFLLPGSGPSPNSLDSGLIVPTCKNGTPFATLGNGGLTCGYLTHFFPNGQVPGLPPEVEVPTAKQQAYGLYAQDTYSPSARLKVLLGLRLDGFNFLIPDDPQNPPAVDGVRHQRLYEPKASFSYTLGRRDLVRASFGRTLSIPLPTFLGTNIDRSAFSAFDNVPSYDNTKGAFDPNRPLATAATYCGVAPQAATGLILGTQLCTSYADQLYWLMRNYRFSLQKQIGSALRGSTFTNYDFSYAHDFGNNLALKLTPFYRRGYDVVESTRYLLGVDSSGAAELSPLFNSNAGIQSAAGVEMDFSKERPYGLSYRASATYINQIGNDPPGDYLPAPSLALGLLYHSPTLSPFQSSLGITYRSRGGIRINPVLTYRYGYPYGVGVYQAAYYNGVAVYVPNTNVFGLGTGNLGGASAIVDPQNPGTVTNPVIVTKNIADSLTSGPGSLRARSTLNADLTLQFGTQNSTLVYGLSFTNLFNQLSDIPVLNQARILYPVGNGLYYTDGSLATNDPTHTTPSTVNSSYASYLAYPNQPPLAIRAYVQVKL